MKIMFKHDFVSNHGPVFYVKLVTFEGILK